MTEIKAIIDRQEARLREMQTWLAILVSRHGLKTGIGWRYEVTQEEAILFRQLLKQDNPFVAITVDRDGVFNLEVM